MATAPARSDTLWLCAGMAVSTASPPNPEETVGLHRRAYAAGTGNAVTDLIFSIAKREVTFFSGTAPISFL